MAILIAKTAIVSQTEKTLKELFFRRLTDLVMSPMATAGHFLMDVPLAKIPGRGCGASNSVLCYVL
jgi:hypothetical protein